MGNPLKNLRFWLFITTFISCAFAETYYASQFSIYNPISILYGLPFALSLMFILLSHESGHYFAAKWWKTKVTGPLFIPLPVSPIGTMGAIIRMDPATIANRRALFDISAAGPWAGIIATAVILFLSDFFKTDDRIFGQMALAMMVGTFLTVINLFPFGQLDGGHILYTINQKNYRTIEILSIVFLVMYLAFFQRFLNPAILIFFILVGGLYHPPTQNDNVSLGKVRTVLVIVTLILFFAILFLISMF